MRARASPSRTLNFIPCPQHPVASITPLGDASVASKRLASHSRFCPLLGKYNPRERRRDRRLLLLCLIFWANPSTASPGVFPRLEGGRGRGGDIFREARRLLVPALPRRARHACARYDTILHGIFPRKLFVPALVRSARHACSRYDTILRGIFPRRNVLFQRLREVLDTLCSRYDTVLLLYCIFPGKTLCSSACAMCSTLLVPGTVQVLSVILYFNHSEIHR